MSLVLALIIVVAAFTVIATLIMVVLDKTKEIAVMKAMGATDQAILRIFLYPTATLDVDRTAFGLLLGGVPPGANLVTALAGELAHGHALATSGDRTVAAEMAYGSGSVVILGLNPGAEWLKDTKLVDGVWRRLLPPRPANGLIFSDDSSILQGVFQMPALALPPIGGLLLLLAGYILVIGPLNSLILKRLDRRELAWITIPAFVVAFAAAAYGYGSVLRGTDVVVNEAAVVRGAPDSTEGQAQVYFGVFSPTRGTYRVDVHGDALLASPINTDMFGTSTGSLDVVQGNPAAVRDLAIGFGSLRVVRAETTTPVPRMRASLALVDSRLKGTFENASDETLEDVSVVLGSSVVKLKDVPPHTTVPVNQIVRSSNQQSLADTVIGPIYNGSPVVATDKLAKQAIRYQLVQQLSWDPMFGWNNALTSEDPVVLAFASRPVLDVTVSGQPIRHTSNVVYYVPFDMSVSGKVTLNGDLMHSTIVAVDSPQFSKDPWNYYMGFGKMSVAYQPIDFEGTLSVYELSFVLSQGYDGIPRTGGKPVEVIKDPPELCTDLANSKPDGCQARRADMMPEVELFDHVTGAWVRLPRTGFNVSSTLPNPERYYDPSTKQVLVRFVNADPQNQIGFAFQISLVGLVR